MARTELKPTSRPRPARASVPLGRRTPTRIFCHARRVGRREPRAAYAADALVALASEGPCKPVEVRVTVDSAALARGHTAAGERCEIHRVGPVPVTTARALLDDASVSVLLRDGDDITAVSSPKRTIPMKLRRARGPLPDLRRQVLRKRPVPPDRPRCPGRGTRRDHHPQHLANLLASPPPQDVRRLEGRWRIRQLGPRPTR